jgi:dienelactone hydrolase
MTSSHAISAEPTRVEKGAFRFTPIGDQKDIPTRYRLDARTFDYEMSLKYDLARCDLSIYRLRFPSPVESPHSENNTVHAEYYVPRGKGPFPGVIVLDITGGDQSLSRGIATYLAQNQIAGLFVQMAYYGPRRPPGSNLRLLSPDIAHTMAAVRQTVLDLRAAAAWLESRTEIDAKRIGILGTSLGSFMAALTAEMEPRLDRVAILLGGGGFVDGYYDHPLARPYSKVFEALGGSKEKVARLLAPVDPLTCAANLKQHRVLMLAARRDEIVPPKMAEALWNAAGRPKIVWYDCGHYTALMYLADGLDHIMEHFKAP